MEKFGQREPVEGVVDDLLNAVAASEFNEDLDVNFPISIPYNHIIHIQGCFYLVLKFPLILKTNFKSTNSYNYKQQTNSLSFYFFLYMTTGNHRWC